MHTQKQPTGFLARFLSLAGVMVLAAGALTVGEEASAGISNTRHNLGSTGTNVPGGQNHVNDTGDICVFCHTPHGADVSTRGAPLWNKRLGTSSAYTIYTSSTLGGARANDGIGGGSVGSTSMACLSCHDGTQAMDNIINTPGSGTTDTTGAGGGTSGLNWTWAGGTGRVDAAGFLQGIARLGTDLGNDHPIGIQYCGGGITTTTNTCNDGDFRAPTQIGTGTASQWYVDSVNAGGTTGARDKTDMILQTRNFAGGLVGPSVECGSCHDPHVEAKTTGQVAFMRVSTVGSAICLTCHTK